MALDKSLNLSEPQHSHFWNGGTHLPTICEIGVAIKGHLIIEALGFRTEAWSHWLEGKGHGEAAFDTDVPMLLDNTQARVSFLQKGNRLRDGWRGAAQGHSESQCLWFTWCDFTAGQVVLQFI